LNKQAITSVIKSWSEEVGGECKPSAVCTAVADSGLMTFHHCAEKIQSLLQTGEIKIEPQGRGLYVP